MFEYKDENLCLNQKDEFIPLNHFTKNQDIPFYLYDLDGMRQWYRFFIKKTSSKARVFFAMKANNNPEVLKVFLEEGAGVDVVSGGEMDRAKEVGFSPQQMIFSGVGKSLNELTQALNWDILQINVESLEELKALTLKAKELKKRASISLRMNPNVDFESHSYIKTGLAEHKFGINEEQLPEILKWLAQFKNELCLRGLSFHIGSQIFDLKALFQAAQSMKTLYGELRSQGWPLKTLDMGGGLGVDYSSYSMDKEEALLCQYGAELNEFLKDFPEEIYVEPGRFLIARFGLLCARVEYVKKTSFKKFIIINSGMHHFLRPALYQAVHRILPFKKGEKELLYDVVGPICETGDVLAKNVLLPPIQPGEWLAIADTGAYGEVMSNRYNLQLPVQEISVSGGKKQGSA